MSALWSTRLGRQSGCLCEGQILNEGGFLTTLWVLPSDRMMFFSVAALMRLPLSSEIVDFHVAASEESRFLARQTRAGMTEKGNAFS